MFSSTYETTHQEGGDERNDTAIGVEAIGNSTHAVLTNTVADVAASVCAKTGAGGLEVNRTLNLGQVATSQIGGSTNKVGQGRDDGRKHDLRKFARGDSGVRWLVDRKFLLPALRKLASNATNELCVLIGVLLTIGRQEGIPLALQLGTALAKLSVQIVSGLRNSKLLLRVETKLGLEGDNIVSLES